MVLCRMRSVCGSISMHVPHSLYVCVCGPTTIPILDIIGVAAIEMGVVGFIIATGGRGKARGINPASCHMTSCH